MHKPNDYLDIRAWSLNMGSYEYYIKDQQAKAAADGAPVNAIYFSIGRGRWVTADEITSETTKERHERRMSRIRKYKREV